MGIYKSEQASADAIVLRHEGDDDHTITIAAQARGDLSRHLEQVKAGHRYYVSISVYEVQETPVIEEPAVDVEVSSEVLPDPLVEQLPDGSESAPSTDVGKTEPPAPDASHVDESAGAEVVLSAAASGALVSEEPPVAKLPAWAVPLEPARTVSAVDVTLTSTEAPATTNPVDVTLTSTPTFPPADAPDSAASD